MGIRKDCRFYKCDDDLKGCTALNRLYCKEEKKACAFFKSRHIEYEAEKKARKRRERICL